jgi:hypothetical protein
MKGKRGWRETMQRQLSRSSLFLLLLLAGQLLLAALPDRCFKEDHYTGADYIRLQANGTYSITGREHMGIWVLESGRWEQAENTIKFTPTGRKRAPCEGVVCEYKNRKFLTFEAEQAPSIPVPLEEVKQQMDEDAKTLPPYVFFAVSKTVYDNETAVGYPFH